MKKYVIGLAVALLLFLAGFYSGKGQKKVIEKIVTETEYVDRVVYKESAKKEKDTVKHTEIVVNKDGSQTIKIIETSKEIEEKQVSSDSQRSGKSKTSSKTTINAQSQYKIGLRVHSNYAKLLSYSEYTYEPTVGLRLGGLPLWLDAGYNVQEKSVSLGIELEF